MKHNINPFAALFMGAAMLLSSCEERMNEVGNIGLTADVANYKGYTIGTKAEPIGDPDYEETTYVPLFATKYGTAGFTVNAYKGTTSRFVNATSSYSGGEWVLNQNAKWYSGEVLDFYAVAPANANVSNLSVNPSTKQMTFDYALPGYTPVDQPDVMVGYYSGEGRDDSEGKRIAPMTFYHPLAAIRLRYGNILDYKYPTLIGITNLYHKGTATVSMPNGTSSEPTITWEVDTEYIPSMPFDGQTPPANASANVIMFRVPAPADPSELPEQGDIVGGPDYTFMVVPQTLSSDSQFAVAVPGKGDDERYYASLEGLTLEAGKLYDITINFKDIEVESFDLRGAARVIPWITTKPVVEINDPQLMPVIGYLTDGPDFNAKLSSLAGGASNINRIVFNRFGSVDTGGVEIQNQNDPRSTEKIYASFSGGVVTITTGANTIYANADCQAMFKNFSNLTSIDFGNFFETIETTNMSEMFRGCSSLTSLNLIDVLDTGGVKNMSHMFDGCSRMTSLNLGNDFNTAAVEDMSYMFNNCFQLQSLDLGLKFYTSKVKNMEKMFADCRGLTNLDLMYNFDTSKVTNMQRMFENCLLTNLHFSPAFSFASISDSVPSVSDPDVLVPGASAMMLWAVDNGTIYCRPEVQQWLQDSAHNTQVPANARWNIN